MWHCNTEYKGKRVSKCKFDKRMILVNSTEAQIIANTYEDSYSYYSTIEIVTYYLLNNEKLFLTISIVRCLIKRLDLNNSIVEKSK